jgi:vacuolar-type H+-ATPase catalytic subunit A/Vma1
VTDRISLRPASDERATPPHVVRVNGPLVEVGGLAEVAVAEIIEVGSEGLAAEVI